MSIERAIESVYD